MYNFTKFSQNEKFSDSLSLGQSFSENFTTSWHHTWKLDNTIYQQVDNGISKISIFSLMIRRRYDISNRYLIIISIFRYIEASLACSTCQVTCSVTSHSHVTWRHVASSLAQSALVNQVQCHTTHAHTHTRTHTTESRFLNCQLRPSHE